MTFVQDLQSIVHDLYDIRQIQFFGIGHLFTSTLFSRNKMVYNDSLNFYGDKIGLPFVSLAFSLDGKPFIMLHLNVPSLKAVELLSFVKSKNESTNTGCLKIVRASELTMCRSALSLHA